MTSPINFTLSGSDLRPLRDMLKWSKSRCSTETGLSFGAIIRYERSGGAWGGSRRPLDMTEEDTAKVVAAFARHGIQIDENGATRIPGFKKVQKSTSAKESL